MTIWKRVDITNEIENKKCSVNVYNRLISESNNNIEIRLFEGIVIDLNNEISNLKNSL